MGNIVEINGVQYLQKEQKASGGGSRIGNKFLMMAMMFGGMGMMGGFGGGGRKEKETPKVDIIKEYGLIQLKKSNLSKAQRDWVEWQFELNFTKIVRKEEKFNMELSDNANTENGKTCSKPLL